MSGNMSKCHAYVPATLPVLGWFFVAFCEKIFFVPIWGFFDDVRPCVYLFPQSVGEAILVFSLGRRGRYGLFADRFRWDGEFSFLFPGSFAGLAPSQQFSVLCIFPHVSHLGFGGSF